MSEHTPGLWKAEDTMGVRCVCIVHTDGHFDGDWFVNALVQNRASTEDDARFIAHAANHHDELLAACEAQSRLIEAQTQMLTSYRIGRNPKEKTLKVMDSRQGIEEQAKKAIAKAKGESGDG